MFWPFSGATLPSGPPLFPPPPLLDSTPNSGPHTPSAPLPVPTTLSASPIQITFPSLPHSASMLDYKGLSGGAAVGAGPQPAPLVAAGWPPAANSAAGGTDAAADPFWAICNHLSSFISLASTVRTMADLAAACPNYVDTLGMPYVPEAPPPPVHAPPLPKAWPFFDPLPLIAPAGWPFSETLPLPAPASQLLQQSNLDLQSTLELQILQQLKRDEEILRAQQNEMMQLSPTWLLQTDDDNEADLPPPEVKETKWQKACRLSNDYLYKPLESDQESELEALVKGEEEGPEEAPINEDFCYKVTSFFAAFACGAAAVKKEEKEALAAIPEEIKEDYSERKVRQRRVRAVAAGAADAAASASEARAFRRFMKRSKADSETASMDEFIVASLEGKEDKKKTRGASKKKAKKQLHKHL